MRCIVSTLTCIVPTLRCVVPLWARKLPTQKQLASGCLAAGLASLAKRDTHIDHSYAATWRLGGMR